eukprot:m.11356 g.11356  ORF g.11356 m.11356 type:complete len:942 (-) comp8775_c0_seq1:102-2927(-)
MLRSLWTAVIIAVTVVANDPSPDPAAIVWCDALARFTILTKYLVRAEWVPQGSHPEDRATFAIVNRRTVVPSFAVVNNTDWCNITIKDQVGKVTIVVAYSHHGGSSKAAPFHGRLQATSANGTMWRDGDGLSTDTLGGTVYDLKGCTGELPLTCENTLTNNPECTNGVLSRVGWATFNDGENNVFIDLNSSETSTTDREWANSRHSGEVGQDIYIFMYDSDYRGALTSLASVSGKMAIPPRRFFGVWWSRWEKYTQNGLEQVITRYEQNELPLDGINLDTEWHINTGYLDSPNDQRLYSGAFDWDTSLYPAPMKMVEYLRARNLWPVYFDIHQAAGVLPINSQFTEFAKDMGHPGRSTAFSSQIDSSTYTKAFFKLLKNQVGGTNYWWLDNGYPNVGHVLSNVPGFNDYFFDRHVFFNDSRQVGRPSIMGPFFGLGTQRYPFVHSGDLVTGWATLKFLPYYTLTAANVLISFIAHDIGGHRMPSQGDMGNDPELYTRWTQYGAWTAQLRPHSQKYALNFDDVGPIERRIWEYPYEYFDAMRTAMQRRSTLVPYIYSAALDAFQTDIPFLRGLYVDHPQDETVFASQFRNQYLFGNAIAVAPITDPMDRPSNISFQTVYLPSTPEQTNTWVHLDSGRCVAANQVLANQSFTLQEYPVYVRGGSILPATPQPGCFKSVVGTAGGKHACDLSPPLVGAAGLIPPTITWIVILGNATAGSGRLLEDVGDTDAYVNATNVSGHTTGITETIAKYVATSDWINVTISAASDPVVGFPTVRNYVVSIRAILQPTTIVASQSGMGSNMTLTNVTWMWNARTLTVDVTMRGVATTAPLYIWVAMQSTPFSNVLCDSNFGFPGMLARLLRVKKMIDLEGPATRPSMALNRAEETSVRMQQNPESAQAELKAFPTQLKTALLLHLNATAAQGAPSSSLQHLMSAWFIDILRL